MADSTLISSTTIRRARWLALPAALVAAGGALVVWRRGQRGIETQVTFPAVVVTEPVAKTAVVQQAVERKPQSPVRWLLYLGAAMFCGGLLVVLQSEAPELSAAIFTLLMTACILYGTFQSADKIGHLIVRIRHMLTVPRTILQWNAGLLSLVAGGGAVVMSLWSAVLFWDSQSYSDLKFEAFKLFLGSLAVMWFAFALSPNKLPIMTIALSATKADPAIRGFKPNVSLFLRRFGTRSALFMGILLLLIDSEINGQFIKSDILMLASVHVQFVLLVAGTVLVVIGLTGVRAAAVRPTQAWREHWLPLWPLGIITLLALVLRCWHLDLAMRFLVDERSFIDGIYGIKDYPFTGLLQPFSSISAFPYVFPYWQFMGMKLFGAGLIGLRVPSAILGTMTIPATYFLVRNLFDRRTALLAALMLATFPPHIQFSRIAIAEISSPFFAIMAFGFLARAMNEGNRRDFVLGGVMLGFTHYFHEGGRLLYTPVALMWVVGCVVFMHLKHLPPYVSPWGRILRHFQRLRGGLFLMLTGLVIIALPIYLTLIGINRPIFARLVDNRSGLTGDYWREMLTSPEAIPTHVNDHLLPAFEVYFSHTDSTLFYSQTTALLLSGMLPAVMMGFAFVCYQWRKPGSMLLIIWVLSTALGNSLMKDSTGSPRFVMVFPALMILAGVGLRYVIPILVRNLRWQPVIIGLVGIVLAAYQFNFFFNLHLPEYNFVFRAKNDAPDGYDAAWRSINFPPKTQVHLISTPVYNQIELEGLILAWRSDMRADTLLSRRFSPHYLKKLACEVDHAFFVQKKDVKTIELLQRYFKLDPPQFTSFTDLVPAERLVLYYAPYRANDGSLYSYNCTHVGQSS